MSRKECRDIYGLINTQLKDREFKITSRELAVFRDIHIGIYIGISELAKRMSELIWFDIFVLEAAFGVSPVRHPKRNKELEQGESQTGVKLATQFNNLPLKGLWHKHFFSAHFIVNNIILGLGKTGLERLINEVMDPAKSPVITEEMIKELSRRVANEPLEVRDARKKLTGEWIIYLQHQGKNYYLCVNAHSAGDQFICDRIMEHCVRDFSDLPAWLRAQQ
jgi:hypothetical protein